MMFLERRQYDIRDESCGKQILEVGPWFIIYLALH